MKTFYCPGCQIRLNESCSCPQCSFAVSFFEGIPSSFEFSSVNLDSKGSRQSLAVAEQLFNMPGWYKHFVDLKNVVYSDQVIGITEFTDGKDILDVGCGPSLKLRNMEYSPDKARSYTGIDSSFSFVKNARAENPDPKYEFAVASGHAIPFGNKTFDTSILAFTVHHVDADPSLLLNEVVRVTKKNVVIFDHLKSDFFLFRAIQVLYWRLFDGGVHYLTQAQWDELLKPYRIVKRLRTGAIFGHVVKYVLELRDSFDAKL